jgi:MFS family permease
VAEGAVRGAAERLVGVSARARREFTLLWAGQTVSETGTQVTALALPLVAVDSLHEGALAVGGLAACSSLPYLIAGLPTGALVERWRKRRVMVVTDVARAAVLASVPLAWWLGVLGLAQLYAVALVVGALSVFFDVAYQSVVPVLVGPEDLLAANARLQASASTAQVGGPAVAGALAGVLGAAGAVAVDCFSFVVSVVSLLGIQSPEVPVASAAGRGSLRREMREGLDFVRHQATIRTLALTAGTCNLFEAAGQAVLLLWLRRHLGLPADRIGIVLAVGCVGGVVGAAAAPAVARRLGLGRALLLGVALAAAGNAAFPLATHGDVYELVIVGQATSSFGALVFNVNQVSLRQALCPPQLLGRMTASVRTVVSGALPVGALLGGSVGELWGLRAALWVSVAGGAAALAWLLVSPLGRMRVVPPAPTPIPGLDAQEPATGAPSGADPAVSTLLGRAAEI